MPARAQAIDAMAKGDHYGGTGMLGRRDPGEGEQAGSDHRADAEGDEAPGTEGALELVLPPFGIGIQSLEGFRPG